MGGGLASGFHTSGDEAGAGKFFLGVPPVCITSAHGERGAKYPFPIYIPAGMAFGTGEHATTEMCLRQLVKMGRREKRDVLDAGTGSGILALAAAALGHRVSGIDCDEVCIREAKKNALLNAHIPKVRWKKVSLEKLSDEAASYDVITANLFSDILVGEMEHLARLLKPEGRLILSGILKEQAGDVVRAIRDAKLTILRQLRKGKWVCILAEKSKIRF